MKAEEIVQLEFHNGSLLRHSSSGTWGQHRPALPPRGRHVPFSNVVLATAVLTEAFCGNCREIANSTTIVAFDAFPPSTLHQHFCHSTGVINEPSLQSETGYAQHRA